MVSLLKLLIALIAFAQSPASQPSDVGLHDPEGRVQEARLRQAADAAIRRHLTLWEKAYQLDPEQRAKIEAALRASVDPQIRYTYETLAKKRAISAQAQLEFSKMTSDSKPSEELRRHMRELREINRQNPLFDEANALKLAESLLPPEQVAEGRKRLKVLIQEGDERQRRRMSPYDHLNRLALGRWEGPKKMLGRPDGWESVVDTFCRELGLDEDQKASAQTALREGIAERNAARDTRIQDWEAVLNGFPEGREDVLNAIQVVWERMLARLNSIPTRDQFERTRARRSQRQPLMAAATRPSDFVTERIPPQSSSSSQPAASSTAPAR